MNLRPAADPRHPARLLLLGSVLLLLLWSTARLALILLQAHQRPMLQGPFLRPQALLAGPLGLRLRPRWLMNFELEMGLAIPLQGVDPRFYGGKVDRP